MSSKVDELVELFLEKDYMMKMGANKLSKRLKTNKDDIYEAKAIVKAKTSKSVESINSKGKIKSRWQGASGEWFESYKFEDDKEDSLNSFRESFLSELKKVGASQRTHTNTSLNGDYMLTIDLPDFHMGKIDGSTLSEQGNLFVSAGLHLYNQAKSKNISKVLIPLGNDFLNSEHDSKTTRGTDQQNNNTFYNMFVCGWTSIVKLVNLISNDVKVDLVMVPGNHDTNASIMLGEVLKAYYESSTNVNIDSNDELTKYYNYGSSLFMLNHGDKIKISSELALRMAVDQPALWNDCEYKYIFLGHYHKESSDTVMGIEVERKPALTSADYWHKAHNFISKPKMTGTLYHKTRGKAMNYNVYLEHIKLICD